LVPGFARLWAAGGIGSSILWLEVLAAGLFTLQATGSALAVAIVSAARSLPLLASGALIGVVAETVNRKRIVLGGLLLAAASSGSVSLLAFLGVVQPWHVGLAALASGLVYATEYPARRRMIAECAGPARVGRAVALDSLTNFGSRCAGPLAGGAAYGAFGLGGTFAASATLSLFGAILVAGVPHVQEPKILSFAHVRRDLADGFAFVRRTAALRALLGVTIVMNMFGYAYTVLMAPIGREAFGLSPAGVGILAASEPAGALLGGLAMTVLALPGRPLRWLAGGVALLLSALATVPLLPPLWPVCAVLLVGGIGSGLFTNHQTTIALSATPPALRSRVMGLLTTCIGCWPLGQLFVGLLTLELSPLEALTTLGLVGLALLALTIAVVDRGRGSFRSFERHPIGRQGRWR
jgi:MFS family permease